MYYKQKGEYCNLEVRYIPGRYPLMLFGDAFMRKYTVVYNKQANEVLSSFNNKIKIYFFLNYSRQGLLVLKKLKMNKTIL